MRYGAPQVRRLRKKLVLPYKVSTRRFDAHAGGPSFTPPRHPVSQLTRGDLPPAQEPLYSVGGSMPPLYGLELPFPLAPDGKFEPNSMPSLLLLGSFLTRGKITIRDILYTAVTHVANRLPPKTLQGTI